ncbi:MAG: helix-turn-helix transcriptional regulator [Leptospirales bacterium]
MIKLNKTVLQRFESVIKNSGLNKKEFAATIGLAPASLSELTSGRTKAFSNPVLKAMAAVHGVNINWLTTGKEEPYTSSNAMASTFEFDLLYKYRRFTTINKDTFGIFYETLLRLQEEKEKG